MTASIFNSPEVFWPISVMPSSLGGSQLILFHSHFETFGDDFKRVKPKVSEGSDCIYSMCSCFTVSFGWNFPTYIDNIVLIR